jgi:hypothetical protein
VALVARVIERVSIEPSRRCSKGCSFCYNGSSSEGAGDWSTGEAVSFARDCAGHGVRAISFGGGEPLEWPGIFDALRALDGVLLRSLTTNGLLLDDGAILDALVRARPDKVHVSIHAPENPREVARVVRQVHELARRGLRSGVNLLVRRSRLPEATAAARALAGSGIGRERIVLLPMRGADTPRADEVARVAGGPFQSMSCLRACGRSPRFASIAADRTVAWCSYTLTRRPLAALTHAALIASLDGLGLASCDGGALVKIGRGLSSRPRAPSREREGETTREEVT